MELQDRANGAGDPPVVAAFDPVLLLDAPVEGPRGHAEQPGCLLGGIPLAQELRGWEEAALAGGPVPGGGLGGGHRERERARTVSLGWQFCKPCLG